MVDSTTTQMKIPMLDDFHVHLRQDEMMTEVAPRLVDGGCCRALVMPNTNPPIRTCHEALEYKQKLQNLAPSVDFLMTLYLGPWVTLEDLQVNARACGVQGVKIYPKGVTTNSDVGVESFEPFYPIFETLESLGLSLHLHGELPGESPMDAEAAFLPQLIQLAEAFPKLRIVLEHVSTAAAIETVKSLGGNVAATITAHHIDLVAQDILDGDAVQQPHLFCKPLPKTPKDRDAIRQVIKDGHPKFFLGSDSAPHPKVLKEGSQPPPAGVFTSAFLASYLADAFERMDCLDNLQPFACEFGARFFGLPTNEERIPHLKLELARSPFIIPEVLSSVVPYRSNTSLLSHFKQIEVQH